jgi:predicted nucleic acid-binding protein
MIVALDTDVLVNWAMSGAPAHSASRRFMLRMIDDEVRLGLVPQVLFEFLHVVTDSRRFENPLQTGQARSLVRELWDSPDAERIIPGSRVLHRTMELMDRLRLGRKRILDTAFAATLEEAGVRHLATLNQKDFEAFDFLEVVTVE